MSRGCVGLYTSLLLSVEHFSPRRNWLLKHAPHRKNQTGLHQELSQRAGETMRDYHLLRCRFQPQWRPLLRYDRPYPPCCPSSSGLSPLSLSSSFQSLSSLSPCPRYAFLITVSSSILLCFPFFFLLPLLLLSHLGLPVIAKTFLSFFVLSVVFSSVIYRACGLAPFYYRTNSTEH